MNKRILVLIALLVFALPLAVMAQEATPEPMVDPIELPAVDVLALDGDIIAAGSSSVFPLA